MATPLIDEALEILRDELLVIWGSLDEEDREGAERSVRDGTDLVMRRLEGEDVEKELAEVAAQMRCWSFAGSSIVRRGVLRALNRWAQVVGRVLLGLALGAFAGLAESDSAVGELVDRITGGGDD